MNPNNKRFSEFYIGETGSFTVTVTPEDIATFCDLTGDHNPLHLDPDFAAQTRFKKCLIPGWYLGSLVGAAAAPLCGMYAVNLSVTYRVPAPAFAGDTLAVSATVTELMEEKHDVMLSLCIKREDGTVVMQGENKVRIMDKKL